MRPKRLATQTCSGRLSAANAPGSSRATTTMLSDSPWSNIGRAISDPGPGGLGARQVGRSQPQVVEDARLARPDELGEESAVQDGQAVAVLPGVDLLGPEVEAGDADARRREFAAAEGDTAVG